MAEMTTRRIGKYEIQAELGRGGFGRVYRAYDPVMNRLVAIKILKTGADREQLDRFQNEAAAAGNLHHRNIVTIYDFGDHDGQPYIVMEFLEGQDLQQVIASRRPLTLLEKVSIMRQVADGLHSAHKAGVIHRDVKPANILLLPDGAVKIVDFGTARLVGDGTGACMTLQMPFSGTLQYMAPEQVLGAAGDFLCDIFAYGVTYYEFLTGNHPFHADDAGAVLYRLTAEDPEPVRKRVPECPEALEDIVRHAMQKDRGLRYQSLRDIQFDTEPILIELRQEHAAALLTEASNAYAAKDLTTAQAIVHDVLDLDPANRAARQLRQQLHSQFGRPRAWPRADALPPAKARYETAIVSQWSPYASKTDDQTVCVLPVTLDLCAGRPASPDCEPVTRELTLVLPHSSVRRFWDRFARFFFVSQENARDVIGSARGPGGFDQARVCRR
jgi:serine/threonine-protein kinase